MKRINALGRRLMPMVFAMGLSLVAFADPATWFVDPANGVDDVSHDGTTWSKAKQSLVEVMKLAQSGDTVMAAVGVYETGDTTVTINNHDALFRVSIPAGVTLVATGACERTIIKGADATTPLYSKGGCGSDSVACVYLAGTGATVQGFTIRDGRAWYESNSSNVYAGGVYAAAGGNIVDCRVIGNMAYRTPAGYGGTWIRCYFSDNNGSIGRCLEGSSAYNCVFGAHSGGYVVFNCSVCNCTFLPSCETAVRESSSHQVCNSLVLTASSNSQGGNFVNCVFGDSTVTNEASTAAVFTDCVKALTADECAIDAETYEPLTGTIMVDNADESLVTFPSGYGDTDFNGNPRKVGTVMDIGAVEWQGYKLTVSEPPAGVAFEGVAVGVNRLATLPFELTVRRTAVDGRLASHVVLDGKTHYFGDLNALELTIATADHDMTLTVPNETFFYVDEKLGNDANAGLAPGAGALATLQAAADKTLSGDTVYVAEGLYTNNVKHVEASGNYPAYDVRVSVPEDVSFIATGRRGKTLIVGRPGTSTEFGEDAIRCAKLGAGAMLQGFTITNGYAVVSADNANRYHHGGGVGADSVAYIVDCDIVNCRAKRAGAGEGGIWIRCYFNDNQCSDLCSGLRSANKLYNCVIDTHGSYFCWDGNFYNCTFTENCNKAFRNTASVPTGDLFNCLILSKSANDQGGIFDHCVFGPTTTIDGRNSSTQDCFVAKTAADVAYNPVSFEPQKGTLMMEAADESLVDFPAGYGETDFRGCQRFLNGAMDIGASEYDWRRDFSEALASKFVTVTEAGRMVTLADGVVTIPADNALTFRVTLEKRGGKVSFQTGGSGTPTVVCATASVTGRDGVWSFVGEEGQSYDVTITAAGGSVAVSGVDMPKPGMSIIFW